MRLPEFKLERFFARWEFEVPHLLCASDLEPFTLDELLALVDPGAGDEWEKLSLGYTESRGHPLLRAEIASLYHGVEPDDVLVFTGAQEAVFAFANVMLSSGDHALVTWPAYQSLYEVARGTGADVTRIPLRWEDGWALNVPEVAAAITSSTKVVVVNFPHNPTGATLPASAMEDLATVCEERGIHLFSDEVYRFLEYDPATRPPAAVEVSERGVSLGVMSKAFGLAGLRVGWITTRDRDVIRRLAAFKDYLTICTPAPSEALARLALSARDRVLGRNLAIVRSNLALLDDFFARRSEQFEWVRPSAGCVGFPRLRAGGADEFCRILVEEEGVLLLPGSVYDHPGGHFRIGFGRRSFPDGIARLDAFADDRAAAGLY